MSNNRVRNVNQATLGPNKAKKKTEDVKPIEVSHGNAPLLTVKFLELILKELRSLNQKLEKVNG